MTRTYKIYERSSRPKYGVICPDGWTVLGVYYSLRAARRDIREDIDHKRKQLKDPRPKIFNLYPLVEEIPENEDTKDD